MKLKKDESEKLFDALLDGYPTYSDIRLMVKFKLDENLANVTTENSKILTVILDLIEWAETKDKVLDLILGAYEKNPDNLKIKEITYQLLSGIFNKQEEMKRVSHDLKTRIDTVVNKLNIVNSTPLEEPAPKNQQQLNFNEYLDFHESIYYIDFREAEKKFTKIKSHFNDKGDTVLFLMEKNLIRQGDLYLKRLRNELKPRRGNFREFYTTYTSGNFDGVVEKIGEYFNNIKSQKMPLNEYIKLVIENLGNSLQNNSVFFIEIKCDINEASEIDPLIPWFIQDFWQPLQKKIQEVTQDFCGIKVFAVIISNLEISQRLSCHLNQDDAFFTRDKLVKIPLLDNWEKQDIYEWLKSYPTTNLKNSRRESISTKIYNETDGRPRDVCYALEQQWHNLTHSPTSC
ncbi:effector-associated domain EAD1-containing protein [Anabaena sp. UHCC 0451]|uniref:effector-associated domain EAD1-containing protein n=1 Tax=Anabaena sp. UHCC 0451 TaxID=2055235 RepID=UPI002B2143D4|nr:effector-associated domain EAD1-containing protein [Anabaena sp. UHCC 0451]MEA5578661.1 effector-associated domain EAD1-containing protein [Anabaena sp. UHCC 0451]